MTVPGRSRMRRSTRTVSRCSTRWHKMGMAGSGPQGHCPEPPGPQKLRQKVQGFPPGHLAMTTEAQGAPSLSPFPPGPLDLTLEFKVEFALCVPNWLPFYRPVNSAPLIAKSLNPSSQTLCGAMGVSWLLGHFKVNKGSSPDLPQSNVPWGSLISLRGHLSHLPEFPDSIITNEQS